MNKSIDMFDDKMFTKKKMRYDKSLSENIGVRVYNTKDFDKFFEVVTKTALNAYMVAYKFRWKRQVAVERMPDGNFLVRISNDHLPGDVQGGSWNSHRSIVLNKESL
jgi:hypothetical protein